VCLLEECAARTPRLHNYGLFVAKLDLAKWEWLFTGKVKEVYDQIDDDSIVLRNRLVLNFQRACLRVFIGGEIGFARSAFELWNNFDAARQFSMRENYLTLSIIMNKLDPSVMIGGAWREELGKYLIKTGGRIPRWITAFTARVGAEFN
jgi:hypothetical protein